MLQIREKAKFYESAKTLCEAILENGYDSSMIPFETFDKQNHFVWEYYYPNRELTIIQAINDEDVRQILIEHFASMGIDEKLKNLSILIGSTRFLTNVDDKIITLLNIGRVLAEKEEMLHSGYFHNKYANSFDKLFYTIFVIETEFISHMGYNFYNQSVVDPKDYIRIASLTMSCFLEQYGNTADVSFVADYFYYRFTKMYYHTEYDVSNIRIDLMVELAKQIGYHNFQLLVSDH